MDGVSKNNLIRQLLKMFCFEVCGLLPFLLQEMERGEHLETIADLKETLKERDEQEWKAGKYVMWIQ